MAAEAKTTGDQASLDALFMGFLVLEIENNPAKLEFIRTTLVPNLSKVGEPCSLWSVTVGPYRQAALFDAPDSNLF